MESPLASSAATLPRTCRILYYGPPRGGKSANLRYIGDCVPVAYRVPIPAPSAGERLAFRLDAAEMGSWLVVAEAVDPTDDGGVGFAHDGVVFVADSAAERLDENLSALEALKICLESAGQDFTSVPMVIQYNKQDEPGSLPLDRLESLLNPWGLPAFSAVATRGTGVKETLSAVLGQALRQLDSVACDTASTKAEPPSAEARQAAHEAGPENTRGPIPSPEDRPPGRVPEPRRRSAAPGDRSPGTEHFPALVAPQPLQIEIQPDDPVLFAGRLAPVVVPVRVPRSLLERHGTVRVVLEIEMDDKGTGLL